MIDAVPVWVLWAILAVLAAVHLGIGIVRGVRAWQRHRSVRDAASRIDAMGQKLAPEADTNPLGKRPELPERIRCQRCGRSQAITPGRRGPWAVRTLAEASSLGWLVVAEHPLESTCPLCQERAGKHGPVT